MFNRNMKVKMWLSLAGKKCDLTEMGYLKC